MTLRREVPQRRREPGISLLAHAIALAIAVGLLAGDSVIAYRLATLDAAPEPVHACPFNAEVESLRIVGAGTCEDPLRVEWR